MDFLSNLIQYWKNDSLTLPAGITDAEIKRFEAQYNVVLPKHFKAYLKIVNGNGQAGTDLFYFWPISEIKSASELLSDSYSDRFDYPNRFAFVDFLISSRVYAIHLDKNDDNPGQVFTIADKDKRIVAKSFVEFIGQYLSDSDKLL